MFTPKSPQESLERVKKLIFVFHFDLSQRTVVLNEIGCSNWIHCNKLIVHCHTINEGITVGPFQRERRMEKYLQLAENQSQNIQARELRRKNTTELRGETLKKVPEQNNDAVRGNFFTVLFNFDDDLWKIFVFSNSNSHFLFLRCFPFLQKNNPYIDFSQTRIVMHRLISQ